MTVSESWEVVIKIISLIIAPVSTIIAIYITAGVSRKSSIRQRRIEQREKLYFEFRQHVSVLLNNPEYSYANIDFLNKLEQINNGISWVADKRITKEIESFTKEINLIFWNYWEESSKHIWLIKDRMEYNAINGKVLNEADTKSEILIEVAEYRKKNNISSERFRSSLKRIFDIMRNDIRS